MLDRWMRRARCFDLTTLSVKMQVGREILPKTKLQADTRHFFEQELSSIDNCTHVRLNIYPDGGVSRFRGLGACAELMTQANE